MKTFGKTAKFIFKSFDRNCLDTFMRDFVSYLKKNQVAVSSVIYLPKKVKKEIVLTSPHVYKDAREQFGRITHKCFINIQMQNQESFINELSKFNIPNGVGFSVKF